jgi:hypothetical protein
MYLYRPYLRYRDNLMGEDEEFSNYLHQDNVDISIQDGNKLMVKEQQ